MIKKLKDLGVSLSMNEMKSIIGGSGDVPTIYKWDCCEGEFCGLINCRATDPMAFCSTYTSCSNIGTCDSATNCAWFLKLNTPFSVKGVF